MSGVVYWPNANTNLFLVSGWDFKFGVCDKGVKTLVLPDEEPRVVDEFKGKVPLRGGVDLIGRFLRAFSIVLKGFSS
jgi:hypothetical protein